MKLFGVVAWHIFRTKGTRRMTPALARLSQSVDKLIEALTTSSNASEAQLNALADKIDAALAPAVAVAPAPSATPEE
jgi:hypothetical protein